MKKQLLISSLIVGTLSNLAAFIGTRDVTNFFRPSDSTVKLPALEERKWQFGSRFEYGSTASAHNIGNSRCNVLEIFNPTQSALAMIENPSSDVDARLTNSDGGNIRSFLQTVQRDGIRGTQTTAGHFSAWDWTLFGSRAFSFYRVPGFFTFSAHFPIRHQEISNVRIVDRTSTNRTQATAVQDQLVKQLITDNLINNVATWGCLELADWQKTGMGDMVLMFGWDAIFPQEKENLKAVELGAKIGVSVPTGSIKDIDKAFSLPMGNDGAWGLPIGVNLGLNFIHHIRAGLDADFMILFDNTSTRRLKTTTTQTEFLLLNKGRTLKEYGLTWQFHLYLQAYRFAGGLSASVGYDYTKHDHDTLTPKTNNFDYSVVNSAESLQEWQSHNMLFKINYDWENAFAHVSPQIELFYKLPIAGKNIIYTSTGGFQVGMNF